MKGLMIRTGAGVITLLALISSSGNALAQSVDDCMSARVNDALKICQSIIDSGSRNSNVYWKLSSAQYQSGQADLANKTLNAALRLYPGDTRLESLREIITTDTSEQALIARSAKLNQNSLDKGALKISCLTKSGDIGISACKRRLELTDQDGTRIRERLATLEEIQQANRQVATPLAPVSRPETPAIATLTATPDPEPFAEPLQESPAESEFREPDQDPQALIAEARRNAYMALVEDVQRRLNDFGFNAGYPDGVPGNNTRRALSEFYLAIGNTPITSITDLTLEELESEKARLDQAKRVLEQSQQALEEGNLVTARSKLAQAKKTSSLLKVPVELQQALQAAVKATEPARIAKAPVTVTPPVRQPATQTVPATAQLETPVQSSSTPGAAGGSSAARFAELIGQINVLHGQIRRQQADRERKMQALRKAM